MADPAVLVEKEGPILLVTLNRPEKRNAIDSEAM
jgi:enoyl-CoA hydratase/carnithine racemase